MCRDPAPPIGEGAMVYANHIARGGLTGTCCVHFLSSEGESVGYSDTINDILPSDKGGSVSSHILHPVLAPPHREREEETKKEEETRKCLRDDMNSTSTIPMCAPPVTVSTFILLPHSDDQCSSVNAKKVKMVLVCNM